jgi:hypothetical protein
MIRKNHKFVFRALPVILLPLIVSAQAATSKTSGEGLPKNFLWMYDDAKWGISHHYLGHFDVLQTKSTEEWQHMTQNFDVAEYVRRVVQINPGWVMFTTTQNTGYLTVPSEVYGRKLTELGKSHDYISKRDLIKEIALALKPHGIRTMVYSPFPQPHFMRDPGEKQHLIEDWWIDFHREMMKEWGDLISGWWFDGYGTGWNHNPNYDVWTKKMTDALESGNPNIAIAYSNAGRRGVKNQDTWEPDSDFGAGERQMGYDLAYLLPGMSRVSQTQAGTRIQTHDWLYVNARSDLYDVGWGQFRKNMHYADDVIAKHMVEAYDKGRVATVDVALNPDSSWNLSALKQMQRIGVEMKTTKDNTYAALSLVGSTAASVTYTGNWKASHAGTGKSSTGSYGQNLTSTTDNGDSATFDFAGKSIVYAASLVPDGGMVEVVLDGRSQGTFSLAYPHKQIPQHIIFERHDLAPGKHRLKIVKKSGGSVNVDVLGHVEERAVKVFVLAGQSNAVGYNDYRQYQGGKSALPHALANQPGILFWNAKDKAWTTLRVGASDGFSHHAFGPEIGFAHDIARCLPNEQIAIVKFAVGGSGIARSRDYSDYIPQLKGFDDKGGNWHPPVKGQTAGAHYQQLTNIVNNALAALTHDGREYEVSACLWMQGEHEAGISLQMANDYTMLLKDLMTSIRVDLESPKLPFIIGEVNSYTWAYGDSVRKAQANVCSEDENAVLVKTIDLSRKGSGGASHFDADGMLILGSRFAKAAVSLVE